MSYYRTRGMASLGGTRPVGVRPTAQSPRPGVRPVAQSPRPGVRPVAQSPRPGMRPMPPTVTPIRVFPSARIMVSPPGVIRPAFSRPSPTPLMPAYPMKVVGRMPPLPVRYTESQFTSIAPPLRIIDLLPTPTILNPIPAVEMPPSQSPGSASSFNPGGADAAPKGGGSSGGSSGGGGGGGGGGGSSGGGGSEEVETDEPVTATPRGLEIGVPLPSADKSKISNRTLLMVGGGLAVAYLLFGRGKKR